LTKEQIIKQAFELGNAISQSAEFEKLKQVQKELESDQDAYLLLIRYQDLRAQAEDKLNHGQVLTAAEEDQLNDLEQSINNNSMLIRLMQIQEEFDRLMQGVYYALNQAISGGYGCSCDGCESCGSCSEGCC